MRVAMFFLAALACAAADADLLATIRGGDLAALKLALAGGADANTADARGFTALHYAALYSSTGSMTVLIKAGARVNAASKAGVTPLFSAIGDLDKVRLLIENGADMNVRPASGYSPVRNAAYLESGAPIAEYLLSKGAQPDTATLSGAIIRGHLNLAKRLLAAGVVPSGRAVILAANTGHFGLLAAVLEKAKSLGTPDGQSQRTALMNAAYYGPAASAALLLERGAEINAKDNRGHTALMNAAGSDRATPEVVKLLLEKGADPAMKDHRGDTAIDFARRRGDAAVMKLLGAPADPVADTAPARTESLPPVRVALARSMKLFDAAGPAFFKANACISCHHQSIPQMAAARTRPAGVAPDPESAKAQVKSVLAILGGEADQMWQTVCSAGGGAVATMTYGLVGLAAENQPANAVTDATVHCLAKVQAPDGSWSISDERPPLGMDPVKYTALAVHALRLYPLPGLKSEFEGRVARGRRFLESAVSTQTQALAFQVLGMKWAGSDAALLLEASARLLAVQRPDGGWSQNPSMPSDAFATAQAVWALHEGAGIPVSDTAWRRGAHYLRSRQEGDGSWHVRARGFGFQPYRDTGFPHADDQWISSAATGFAVMALAPLIEER